jgi:hypothetical protein
VLLLAAGIVFLVRFLPFGSYFIPKGSVSPVSLFLVVAGFSMLILGIVVATVKKNYAKAGLALLPIVSLTGTLVSSSITVASSYGSRCVPGVLSRGFPLPWLVRPVYAPLGFGFPAISCPVPVSRTRLISFTPLFFALDTVFYFAASLAILELYDFLLKPTLARLNQVRIAWD